jgi:hypothetical protein
VPASEILRWGALSAVVGGALLVIAVLYSLIVGLGGGSETFSETALTPSYAITTGMSLFAAVLILFGLVGLNLRQSSETAGALSRVGFLVAFLGTALMVGTIWTEFFVAPSLAVEAPEFLDAEEIPGLLDVGFIASYSLLSLGWALFGVAALRARIYPRWVPILLIIAALIGLVPFSGGVAPLALGIAVALLGFFSLTGVGVSAGEPSRPSRVR